MMQCPVAPAIADFNLIIWEQNEIVVASSLYFEFLFCISVVYSLIWIYTFDIFLVMLKTLTSLNENMFEHDPILKHGHIL